VNKKFIILTFFICVFFSGTAYSQWQPDVRIRNWSANSFTSPNNAWSVASSGPNVYIVWTDLRTGSKDIYFRISTNGGVNWQDENRLTNNYEGISYNPCIAVNGSNAHVVWYDTYQGNPEIYYRRSTNGGANWLSEIRLSNNSFDSYRPSVSVSGSLVHVVWYDNRDGNDEIYYKRSTNSGATWGAETRLTSDISYSIVPSVTSSGNYVHVVWKEGRNGSGFEIYYKRSTDGGASWGPDTRLTNDPGTTESPSISVAGMNVSVVWHDTRDGNNEIYHKSSSNGGTSWGADTRLTNNSSDQFYPSVSNQSPILHVVWYDYRHNNFEIYYKRSTNSGTSWENDVRLTNEQAESRFPSVSAAGSSVHVVWTDSRHGHDEIYYKRNPTGNFVGIENISSEIPNGFSLEQNYPNPFNPVTNINFSIPKSGFVKLVVYDIMGKIAAELVNGNYSAGTYKVDFDASQLSSGTYFYKITAGEFTSVKKMTLVK